MNNFTTEKRVKIIEFYFENKHSIVLTKRSSMCPFNARHSPTKPTIINLMKRFREQSSVADRSQPGRGHSVRTPENTENVRRSIEDNHIHSKTFSRTWNLTEVVAADSKRLGRVSIQDSISANYTIIRVATAA